MSLYPSEWPCFFTATIYKWLHLLREDDRKNIIIESLQYLTRNGHVILNGYVIMSNHVHFIWQPTSGGFSHIQSSFMKFTAGALLSKIKTEEPHKLHEILVNRPNRKFQVWKREPLTVELFSPAVLKQKLEYIHENPVKAGLCRFAEDYKYSSAAFYRNGLDHFNIVSDYRA